MSSSGLSKELSAMVALETALVELSEEEQGRVLTWAASRFTTVAANLRKGAAADDATTSVDVQTSPKTSDAITADSLAEFYDRASPSTDAEKGLVVGYWFQYHEGVTDLDAQSINSQLKHLGHGIGNVTRAFDWLKSQKPALMVQKRKEGTSQQARKKFMVTNEGRSSWTRCSQRVLNDHPFGCACASRALRCAARYASTPERSGCSPSPSSALRTDWGTYTG